MGDSSYRVQIKNCVFLTDYSTYMFKMDVIFPLDFGSYLSIMNHCNDTIFKFSYHTEVHYQVIDMLFSY